MHNVFYRHSTIWLHFPHTNPNFDFSFWKAITVTATIPYTEISRQSLSDNSSRPASTNWLPLFIHPDHITMSDVDSAHHTIKLPLCLWVTNHTLRMMTSSNGNIFRVTGPLCGEFTGPGEFPTQRPVTWSFDVFFDLRLNKRLSKQPRGWWFETLSLSLWRHCNGRRDRDPFEHGYHYLDNRSMERF